MIVALALTGCAAPSTPLATAPSASVSAPPAGSSPVPSPAPTTGVVEPSLPPCTGPESVGCLAHAIQQAADDGQFAGVVLIAKDGQPMWQGAFGKGTEGDIRLDTPLGIASAGKMFTAIAVAKLRDAGKLDFDDPVGDYVPDLPSDVKKATLAQLLSHTSGLGAMSWTTGLVNETGTFHYSNAGFNLLSHAVERVTDQVFADYLEANIFGPAGMTATGFEEPPPRGAPLGAGGEESTVGDLLRFSNALVANELVEEATTNEITLKRVDVDIGGYGYGFAIFTGLEDEVPSIGHIGLGAGDAAAVEINRPLGYTVIALSQQGFGELRRPFITFQKAIGMGYWRG